MSNHNDNGAKHVAEQSGKSAHRQGTLVKRIVATLAAVAVIAASFTGSYLFATSLRSGVSSSDAAATSGAHTGASSETLAASANADASSNSSDMQDNGNTAAESGEESSEDSAATSTAQSSTNEGNTDQSSSSTESSDASSSAQEPAERFGIDVSEIQGHIDWARVKEAGVEFAMIRVGYRGSSEGQLFHDEAYKANLAGTKEAGIDRGVYFYSQAISVDEAKEEAKFLLDALDKEKLEYPVVFDYEINVSGFQTRVANVPPEDASKIAHAFCTTIEDAGYDVMIYGNLYDLDHFQSEELAEWPIWYAEYNEEPSYEGEIAMWQYSCTGRIDGIDADVDLNLDLRESTKSKD